MKAKVFAVLCLLGGGWLGYEYWWKRRDSFMSNLQKNFPHVYNDLKQFAQEGDDFFVSWLNEKVIQISFKNKPSTKTAAILKIGWKQAGSKNWTYTV